MDTGFVQSQIKDQVYVALAERGWVPGDADDDDLLDDLVGEVLDAMDARVTAFLVARGVIDPQ